MERQRKRLAIYIPALYGGGAERVMLNLAGGLARRGLDVDLVLAQAEGAYLAQVPDSVRLVTLNSRPRRHHRTLASLSGLVGYLRRERPTALLSALQANIVAIWARSLARVPTRLAVSEQNNFTAQNGAMPGLYGPLFSRLTRRFYPWADEVIACSKGVADDLSETAGIPRQRIRVIYNPVVTPELQAKAREPLDNPWFAPGEPPVILAVGRLTPQKSFPTLVQAFAKVRAVRPARLLILGEGEARAEVEEVAWALSLGADVALPGFVPNPYPYMARSALLAMSSNWEGLPTVLVEALYCGTPVVSTDCPSGPREILADGLFGRLVPVGDATALAEAILASLVEPRRAPPESWRPYELEAVVDRYASVLVGAKDGVPVGVG